MINTDTNVLGFMTVETSGLEFVQGESTTSSQLHVVFDCGWVNLWSQESLNRSRKDTSGFFCTSISASEFSCGLVKPNTHSLLPVLVKMGIGNNVIMFRHFPFSLKAFC